MYGVYYSLFSYQASFYIFLIAKNLHDSKNSRIFAAKDRNRRDKEYIAEKGLATIRKHAEDFVAKRLAAVVDVSFIAVYTDSFNPQYNKANGLITSLYYRLNLNLSLNIAISLAGI